MEYALVLLVIVLLWLAWRYRPVGSRNDGWEPLELKTARLLHIEEDMSAVTDDGTTVYGRPDRVYRTPDGLHIPVEYKTRRRASIYPSDVAQLSLHAWLLNKNGHPAAGHGYVVIQTPGGRSAHPVRLYQAYECERMISRYNAVAAGTRPARANRGRRCDKCGHKDRCWTDR